MSEQEQKASPLRDIEDAAQQIGRTVARRPRPLVALIAFSLVGFGAAAFGTSAMAPDPALLPTRLVSLSIEPEALEQQIDTLAAHGLQLYRNDVTRSSDTADSLLRRLGVDDPAAAHFLRSDAGARKLLDGKAGKMVQVRTTEQGALEELIARYPADAARQTTHFTRLRVTRQGETLAAQIEVAPLAAQARLGSGTIRTTLFAATDEAGLPDTVASQMAEMLGTDVDFHKDLAKGDTFSVVYEALTADGERITWNEGSGRVLAAEFVNRGKTYSAMWFQTGNGKSGYFALDGKSKQPTFLASPLEFSRITSGFAMRMHPILQTWRQHNGVDYAAPTGTPVRAVGDGTVEFAGWQNGYGNIVKIKHDNDHETVYAHLSRVDVREGQAVRQSDRIGAVGATGWATGPHLHFEFKIDGQQQDPLAIAKGSQALILEPVDRARFAELSSSARAQLAAADTGARLGLAD